MPLNAKLILKKYSTVKKKSLKKNFCKKSYLKKCVTDGSQYVTNDRFLMVDLSCAYNKILFGTEYYNTTLFVTHFSVTFTVDLFIWRLAAVLFRTLNFFPYSKHFVSQQPVAQFHCVVLSIMILSTENRRLSLVPKIHKKILFFVPIP